MWSLTNCLPLPLLSVKFIYEIALALMAPSELRPSVARASSTVGNLERGSKIRGSFLPGAQFP